MTDRIPVILTGQALRSLRDSGYSLAAAIGEVVDNALEAEANSIKIRLDEGQNKRGKKHIHRIAIADDGTGMDFDILHHYPQIGYSTRYMSNSTIGKYGVGAKLAALNFSERLDVWSRTNAESPWMHVYFDLEAAEQAAGNDLIEPPKGTPVPQELDDLLPNGTGTLVVWSKIDRLEEGRHAEDANKLRIDIEKELSRMFRYFLDGGREISVNDTNLRAHDPLYLLEGTFADRELSRHYRRKDVEPKFDTKEHYDPKLIADEPLTFAGGRVRLRVTVYPPEVIRRRGMGGDELALRLRVPDNQGALSFVRLDREINYTNVPKILPGGVEDPDRFIGIEVKFTPELDEYMGVRNVKRGVEPHGDLRALLRERLSKWIPQARGEIQQIWGDASRKTQERSGEHAQILDAVKRADRTLAKSKVAGPGAEQEQQILDRLAKDTGRESPEDKAEYLKGIADLPFVVETVDFPGANFIDIQHLSHQIIVRLNERHPFYQELWQPIRVIAEAPPGSVSGDEATRTARRTLEALTLLIIAYAKAESMDADPTKFLELRDDWGKFLRSLMGKIKDVI
ncbi:ATP-binding protein [Actinoallomurus rhizosphaericola]|uniref:ATP-binding protein n=1 Tax=Actinoallomurus rhizosphaericola TaxID=2952536 RepID=UPI00209370ED|nr:ATP-binding protein [Actinoallomurus rhizosphaericola]MCO5996269.1 ATP-binding protein [Actinoallomurus rhizosphaericola]